MDVLFSTFFLSATIKQHRWIFREKFFWNGRVSFLVVRKGITIYFRQSKQNVMRGKIWQENYREDEIRSSSSSSSSGRRHRDNTNWCTFKRVNDSFPRSHSICIYTYISPSLPCSVTMSTNQQTHLFKQKYSANGRMFTGCWIWWWQ